MKRESKGQHVGTIRRRTTGEQQMKRNNRLFAKSFPKLEGRKRVAHGRLRRRNVLGRAPCNCREEGSRAL